MNLREYVGKRIKLVSTTGKEWIGKATALDLAINYDDVEFDELSVAVDGYKTGEIVFPENEIKSIEVI